MLQSKVSIALRTTILCVALSASLVSLAGAATYHRLDASPAGSYRIDPDHSLAWFTIGHAGVAVVVGRFDKLSGSYTFNPANPAGDKVAIRIPAASINTNFAVRDGVRGAMEQGSQLRPLSSNANLPTILRGRR
ncbi:YceI family protein [Acidithiobacillus ferrooxidans]|uniref:YceI family protein n=1 Tax=Acidithiobacillus ferrooxidans TaxID=920 RepID=UPI001D047338|nr:YceI family protein [Acidithiobacillus ferrooxidans]